MFLYSYPDLRLYLDSLNINELTLNPICLDLVEKVFPVLSSGCPDWPTLEEELESMSADLDVLKNRGSSLRRDGATQLQFFLQHLLSNVRLQASQAAQISTSVEPNSSAEAMPEENLGIPSHPAASNDQVVLPVDPTAEQSHTPETISNKGCCTCVCLSSCFMWLKNRSRGERSPDDMSSTDESHHSLLT